MGVALLCIFRKWMVDFLRLLILAYPMASEKTISLTDFVSDDLN